ncbi:MAG TPA: YncE family protein, partial [Actinomycetota bacterium]|nr:YncE family protein [Actinomycetota bacterium]
PAAVAIGHGSAWVANSDGGWVSRIDLMTNEVTDTIPTGGRPDEIAVVPDAIWVTNAERASVQRIDPISNQVAAEIVIGSGREALTMDLAITPQAVWVAVLENGHIYRIDPDGPPPAPKRVAERGTDVATGDGHVWAMDAERGRVVRLTESTGPDVINIPRQEANPDTDLAVGFGALWVALGDAGTVTRIDLTTGEDSATAVGGEYTDLAVGPDAVWALTGAPGEDEGELVRLDPQTGAITSRVLTLAGSPIDVAAAGSYAWVVQREMDSASRVRVGAGTAASPEPEPEPSSPPKRRPLLTMWPELTDEQRAQAAERLRAGEDAWRGSAAETALQFTREVIGWVDPRLNAKGTPMRRYSGGSVGVVVFKRVGGASPSAEVVLTKCIDEKWWCVTGVGDPQRRGRSYLSVSIRGRNVQLAFPDQRAARVVLEMGYGDVPIITEEMDQAPFSPVEFQLPGRPGESGFLMLRWFDARGRVFSAQGTTLPAGDFAAG